MIDKTAVLVVSALLAAVSVPVMLRHLDDPLYPKVTALFDDSVVNRAPVGLQVDDNTVTIQYCDS